MYPLNDKDLDRLSRDAAEQFDVEPSTSGWEHVEQRLNKELPVKGEKDRKRFIFWIFLIALLSGGSLLGMLMNNKAADSVAQQTKTKSVPAVKETPAENSNNEPVISGKETVDKNNQPAGKIKNTTEQQADVATPANKATAAKDKTSIQKQVAASSVPATVIKKNTKERGKLSTEPSPRPNRRQKTTTKDEVIITDIAANNSEKQNKSTEKANKNTKTVEDKTVNEPVTPVTNDPTNTVADKNIKPDAPATKDPATKDVVKKDVAKKDVVTEPVAAKEAEKKKPAVALKQPLEFGVLIGPDYTSINFKQTNKTGINAGVVVGYRFNSHWSVNTGLIYTKKNYTAVGEDFHAPKHYWVSYVDLHKVKGNCSMLEIPLNVRYDFAERFNNRFFFSTGLSTYLMNHEYYDYYYRYQGTEGKQPWETDSARHYALSVLNLSLGYEHALGKQFSIQAEPYLKIPLKGLGFGSMNMDSYGVYFTLKYKPVWGKK
jgi:Outer membrane protein beta-barrel domain